jgi:hypothetical protein
MCRNELMYFRRGVIYVHAKGEGRTNKTEDKAMTNTSYRFKKDGNTYTTAQGNNRFEAQLNLELQFQTDLTGATFEELWKGKVERTGIVK